MTIKHHISRLAMLVILLAGMGGVLFAQGNSGLEPGLRLGIQLGYPTAVVGGFRTGEDLEFNGLVGTNYNSLTLGANALFTVAKPRIESQIIPITIGPEVLVGIWNNSWNSGWKHEADTGIAVDVLFLARVETTLPAAPVNFYLDLGMGITVIPIMVPAWTGTLGIRYLF